MDQYSNSKEGDQFSQRCADPTARWWSKETVGIVTGGNKGIGYEIVKKLAEMGITVILTARDEKRGSEAVDSLLNISHLFNLHFFCLDVSDPCSIKAFVSWFSSNFSALDILVNNAGVSFNEIGENSVEKAEMVMKTNYWGAKTLTEALLPVFRRCSAGSRILNMTSRLGSFDKVSNRDVREAVESRAVTEEKIEEGVVKRFMDDVNTGTWGRRGWPQQWTDYAVSKMALNAYTALLGRRYRGRGISVNCFCPGFTQTAMTQGRGTHSAQHAAAAAVAIVMLPPSQLPTAHFFACSSNSSTPFLLSKL